jgi:hypothetical protein
LKSIWLKYHSYLLADDRRCLETLAELAAEHNTSYTTQVVTMFKYMKFHYLAPQRSKLNQLDFN